MAEVGLLPFARIALQVSRAVLPRYRQPLQQTPVHATTVAGHSLPDALRRLGLSRGRGAARRTSRTTFVVRGDSGVITFEKGPDGKVTHMLFRDVGGSVQVHDRSITDRKYR